MNINKTVADGDAILAIDGRIDTATSPALETELLQTLGDHNVVIDFTGVDYVSSAGLRILLKGAKKSREKGKRMSVRNIRPGVMEVFNMAGMSRLLTIEEAPEQ